MPASKNAIVRYRVLDRCLNDKYRHYRINDLIDECNKSLREAGSDGVSRRQIYADLAFMKSEEGWNAPIISVQDGKSKYITYSEDFSIQETPLTELELDQLQTIIASLSRIQGLSGEHWIDELLTNLRYRFDMRGADSKVVGFEQNSDLKGLRYLQRLIDAAIKHIPVELVYHGFNKEPQTWTIHPYYLKQYNSRWYLLGYNEKYANLSVIPLDRIEDLKISEKPFIKNKGIDFDRYFCNVIGIYFKEGAEPEDIRLKFSESRFPYVVSKPIHHSQIVEDEDNRIVSLNVIPNKELESQLLWFGNDVEVLFPGWLREKIMQKIALMYKKYFDVK